MDSFQPPSPDMVASRMARLQPELILPPEPFGCLPRRFIIDHAAGQFCLTADPSLPPTEMYTTFSQHLLNCRISRKVGGELSLFVSCRKSQLPFNAWVSIVQLIWYSNISLVWSRRLATSALVLLFTIVKILHLDWLVGTSAKEIRCSKMPSYPLQNTAFAIIAGTPLLAVCFVALRLYARKRFQLALGWGEIP